MESLQTLALAALMSLFEDWYVWEDLKDSIENVEGGWKTWVLAEEMRRVWKHRQRDKKKKLFTDVHRQLVSM